MGADDEHHEPFAKADEQTAVNPRVRISRALPARLGRT